MNLYSASFIQKIGKLSYRAQNQIMRLKSPLSKKNIWWLENFIWIDHDQVLTSNNNDLEKNEGTLYKKGTGIYHTLNSILSEGGL